MGGGGGGRKKSRRIIKFTQVEDNDLSELFDKLLCSTYFWFSLRTFKTLDSVKDNGGDIFFYQAGGL